MLLKTNTELIGYLNNQSNKKYVGLIKLTN